MSGATALNRTNHSQPVMVFRNTMQVNTWAGLVLFVLLMPSFPSLGMPAALETAMRLVPTYYFIEALKLSLAGTASSRIWGHLAVVLACTLLAFRCDFGSTSPT